MDSIKIDGMHCPNCVKAVKAALEALPGAKGVTVDLATGRAQWEKMDVKIEEIKEAIEDIGFEVVDEEK